MPYKTQSPDMSQEMEKVYFDLLRLAGTGKRYERMCSWSKAMIELSRQAIAKTHPEWSRQKVLAEWARRQYGEEAVRCLKAKQY